MSQSSLVGGSGGLKCSATKRFTPSLAVRIKARQAIFRARAATVPATAASVATSTSPAATRNTISPQV